MFLLIVMCIQILSARYTRNRTRFVAAPAELNVNSQNHLLVHAALTAGLYPKILSVDSKSGHLRTITNNQAASFHPSSVNFGRNPIDFGSNHLMYFTLMCALIMDCLELHSNLVLQALKKTIRLGDRSRGRSLLALALWRMRFQGMSIQPSSRRDILEKQSFLADC